MRVTRATPPSPGLGRRGARGKDVAFGIVAVLFTGFWLVAAVRAWPAIAPGSRPTTTPRPSAEVGVPRLAGRIAVAAGGDILLIREGRMSVLAPGGGRRDPALAPDGSRIAYSVRGSIDGRRIFDGKTVPGHLEYASIVARAVAGGSDELLVDGLQRRDAGGFHVVEFETQPAWSPDGESLAFISDGGAGADLQVYAPATRRVRTLSQGSVLADPAWSPDGSTIAVTTYTSGTPGILLVPVEGAGQPRRVELDREGQAYRPSYSPDGRWIVATFRTPRGSDLVAIELASSRATSLTTDGRSWGAVFSPDGEHVAFLREHDGRIDLFAMEVGEALRNGAAPKDARQVTDDGRLDGASRPSWSR